MFKSNPFDVYARYTKRKNDLCALVSEARKLLGALHAEHERLSRAPTGVPWMLGPDMPTDQQLKELMERLVNDRISVLVMGETKNGKSTFINALLGAEVLPSANVPCTSVICSVQYADSKYALVTRRNHADAAAKEMVDLKYAPTSAYAASPARGRNGAARANGAGAKAPGGAGGGGSAASSPRASDGGADGGGAAAAGPRPGDALRPYVMTPRAQRDFESKYECVEVFWPLPLLRHNVVLVDTPGLNERSSMDVVVREHLPRADCVVFVLNATKAITHVEARAITEVRDRLGHGHMFVVLNKMDQVEVAELEATKQWVGETLAELLPDATSDAESVVRGTPNRALFVHHVSSTDALRAHARGEEVPKPFKALHECVGKYLTAERFRPKLLSGGAALAHALGAVAAGLEAQRAQLAHARAARGAQRERLARMSELASSKQARLESSVAALHAELASNIQRALLSYLHSLLPRVEEIAMGLDEATFVPRRSTEYARDALSEVGRALEADLRAWVARELLPLVQQAYDDVIAATRAELGELVRELKLLDGLAFGGLHGMRLGQSTDASRLIESLDFHRSLKRAHNGMAVGGCATAAGATVVGVKAAVGGALAAAVGAVGAGGCLLATLGVAVGCQHYHALSHLKNSAPEIKQQAAMEVQTRLAAAIDDESDAGLVPTLSAAAVKPIDDAVRHLFGTYAMQLASIDRASGTLQHETDSLQDALDSVEATLAKWTKLINRTKELLAG